MELKQVIISEIHWSIGWNESQEANLSLQSKIGDTSRYFAKLKVGNNKYQWLVDELGPWQPMLKAAPADRARILTITEDIRREVHQKLADNETLANKICQVPNYEEYIFYKPNAAGGLDVAITGWGFHNFKRFGPFKEQWPPQPKQYDITIAFLADGVRQPFREFSIVTPKMRKPDVTNEAGVKVFHELPGTSITIIDELTQRQFDIVTTDSDAIHEFDVTVEPLIIEEPPVVEEEVVEEEPPVIEEEEVVPTPIETPTNIVPPVVANLTVQDAKGQPLRGARVVLAQGDDSLEGILNEQGMTQFEKNVFAVGQPLTATITMADGRQETAQFTLDDNENDYLLHQVAPKEGSRLMEVLFFLLLLLVLASLLIFAFQPGISYLSTLINHLLP